MGFAATFLPAVWHLILLPPMKKTANTDKFLVSQSNDLIEATYSPALTARAHKVARLILALVKPNEQELRQYTVRIEDLKQYLGYTDGVTWGRFYDDLKDISKRLNSEPIELKSEKRTLVAYFISSYLIDLQEGTIVYEISGQLKPYLIQLKSNFSTYLLSNIPKLNSKYSIRLYELLHQYRKIGRRVFEVDDLQKKLGSEYDKYSHFKARVLEASKADLEANTDLAFDYEEQKAGKRVARIEFFIFPNSPAQEKNAAPAVPTFLQERLPAQPPSKGLELSAEVLETLRKLKISEKIIEKHLQLGFKIIQNESDRKEAIRRCGDLDAYFLEKINLMRESKSGQDKPAGFLIKALQEDWKSGKSAAPEARAAAAPSNRDEVQRKIEENRKKLKQLEAKKEVLSQEIRQHNAPIYERLLADEAVFGAAFEQVLAETGDFIKNNVFSSLNHLPPAEQYRQSTLLENMVNAKLREQNPHLFQPANQQFSEQMKNLDAEIKALR